MSFAPRRSSFTGATRGKAVTRGRLFSAIDLHTCGYKNSDISITIMSNGVYASNAKHTQMELL